MNKQQFISFMEAPEKITGTDAVLLNDVIKQFPFFQTAHLLYAKSLYNTQSIHYNNQLKTTAAYASDRKILYQLITNKKLTEDSDTDETREVDSILVTRNTVDTVAKEITKDEPIVDSFVVSTHDSKHSVATFEKAVEEMVKEEVVELNIVKDAIEETKELIIDNTLTTTFATKTNEVEKIDSIIEEQTTESIIDNYVADTSVKKISEVEETNSKEQTKELVAEESISVPIDSPIEELEKEFLESAAISIYSEKTLYELPEIERIDEARENQEKEILNTEAQPLHTEEEPNSFTDWLKNISAFEKPINQPVKPSELTPNQTITTNDKLSNSALIDKFISESPKISKPKAEFFNPVNMAKQSVAEDISFVSETLAKIYELQGNYSKALAAYENLRLKYPEKRLYFASQIKNLKKLINQNNIK